MDKWERLKIRLTGLKNAYEVRENAKDVTVGSIAVSMVQMAMEELERDEQGEAQKKV